MSEIRVTPEELDQASNTFNQSADHVTQVTQALTNLVHNQLAQWEGQAHTRFVQIFEDTSKSLHQLTQELHHISQELAKQAQDYRAADKGTAFGS